MHNGQTADPLNPFSKAMKAVSSKRAKTDADHAEMARIEWNAGLYVNEDNQLVIPGENVEATIINGGKKQKMGAVIKSAVWVEGDPVLDHPKSGSPISELESDPQYRFVKAVKVGTSKVMRTRPIIKTWSCDVNIEYDELQINKAQLVSIIQDAGHKVGIGDWRPGFGRFEVEEI